MPNWDATIARAMKTAQAAAAVAGTYRRGAAEVALAKIAPVSGRWETLTELTLARDSGRTDFLILATDLADLSPPHPVRGDRIEIERTVDGTTKTLTAEVMPIDANEPCYRPSDPARTMLRVHARYIASR